MAPRTSLNSLSLVYLSSLVLRTFNTSGKNVGIKDSKLLFKFYGVLLFFLTLPYSEWFLNSASRYFLILLRQVFRITSDREEGVDIFSPLLVRLESSELLSLPDSSGSESSMLLHLVLIV
jgi:hypothetical protein